MSVVQGGVIASANIQRELQLGINTVISDYRNYPTEFSQIFDVQNSKKAYEVDVLRSATTLLQTKDEGAPVQYDSYSEYGNAKYQHVTYALAGAVTYEAMEDNLYMDEGMKLAKMLGDSELKTKEIVAATMMDQGYTTSGAGAYTMWDNQAVFSASHKVGKPGQTQSNMLSTPSALNQTALESAIINVTGLYNNAGLLAMIRPRKLIVPRSDTFIVERICASFLQSDNANNAINAIKSTGLLPEGYMVAHYLNNQTNWFLLTDQENGLKFFLRSEFSDKDNDFATADYRHKVMCRFSVGASDWRGFYGSGNAGS
jgi:hypothetical protein